MGDLPSEREDKPPFDPRLLFLLRVMANGRVFLILARLLCADRTGHDTVGRKHGRKVVGEQLLAVTWRSLAGSLHQATTDVFTLREVKA